MIVRPVIELASGDATAAVSPLGAEWVGWRCAERELLWSGDARWWPRHSPLLFPLVGRLRDGVARFGECRVAMPVHGFASSSSFDVVDRASDRVALRLRSDETTRACYPFDFELRLDFVLAPRSLAVDFVLRNTGDDVLPYSLGLHPGFAGPPAQGGVWALHFAEPERCEVPVVSAQGLFTHRQRRLPFDGTRLPLGFELLADEALCFLGARSRRVRLESPQGSAIVVEAEGFDHWALWQAPGAPFVCVESWTGHGDAEDFDGDFAARPSTRLLAAGGQARHRLRYGCEPGERA